MRARWSDSVQVRAFDDDWESMPSTPGVYVIRTDKPLRRVGGPTAQASYTSGAHQAFATESGVSGMGITPRAGSSGPILALHGSSSMVESVRSVT